MVTVTGADVTVELIVTEVGFTLHVTPGGTGAGILKSPPAIQVIVAWPVKPVAVLTLTL